MLSSQTKDEVTHAAVKSLRTAIGGEITLGAMLAASAATIQGAINKVGFWQKKTTCVPRDFLLALDLAILFSDVMVL